MSISRFFTQSVTIATPSSATRDAEGVPSIATSTSTVDAAVQPVVAQQGEELFGKPEAERARRVWLPSGTTITANSTVSIDGETFEVWGDPKPWTMGRGADHIAVTVVRRVR